MLEKRVRQKLERGDYDTADVFIREAVHRLIEEDEVDLADLRERLQRADSEIERGEGLEFDEDTTKDFTSDIHERGIKHWAASPQSRRRHPQLPRPQLQNYYRQDSRHRVRILHVKHSARDKKKRFGYFGRRTCPELNVQCFRRDALQGSIPVRELLEVLEIPGSVN